jgi:TolB protein
MNLDGTDQKVLTNSTAVDFDPTFYPDGGKIAFSSRRDGNSNIYIMNADGTDQIRLTDNLGDDSHPSFCPIPVP